jgi:dTDP-4-dehydrorhamnose reductase
LFELIDNNFNGILHIAGRDRCSKLEFANAIAEVFELDAELIQPASTKDIDFDAPRGGDLSLSTNRARNLLECSLPTLRKGIDNMRNDE